MIIREERIGGQRLILGDCREIIGDLTFDAVCTDPPYGIAESGKKNASRRGLAPPRDYGDFAWDNARADLSILPDCPRIIWGGNYYPLPPAPRWLVWDKENSGDFADGEMAWCSVPGAMRIFRWQWNGFIRKGEMDKTRNPVFRVHPTQKPVALMEWCLGFLPNAQTILDPFMGSGTTLIACERLARNGTGIELDPDYFDMACKRVDEATRQPDLLIAPPKPQTLQQGFDL
jgi:site-specific DNA-methyltransferase (adenine-specific)/modification methylase